jgi:hypothetical protein
MVGESKVTADERMLSDQDLTDIADEVAKIPDTAGNAPSATAYTDTYDLYRAAAEGWRQKAGMVAEEFDFEAEGGSFSRSQKYRNYLAMAARYAGMAKHMTTRTGELE